MNLHHLIYVSVATDQKMSAKDVHQIAARSQSNNDEVGVTGMLLHHDGDFLQVIEGDREILERLYAVIADDPRHGQLKRLIIEPIEQRQFADWSMGYAELTDEQLAELPGFNDAFQGSTALSSLAPGRAKDILKGFKNGKWRLR